MTECECYAAISEDDPRAEIWRQITPDLRIPLRHPIPRIGQHNGQDIRVYEGDPSRLSQKQQDLLVELMAAKFDIPESAVREGLDAGQMPVKDDNVVISICALHWRCMM